MKDVNKVLEIGLYITDRQRERKHQSQSDRRTSHTLAERERDTQRVTMNNMVNCRVCRQMELYGHLRALYIANADAPTDPLRLSVAGHGPQLLTTPANLYDFVESYMVGYGDVCCDAHRNTDNRQCITVLFVLDQEREIVEPPSVAEWAMSMRLAVRESTVQRRILSEVLDVVMSLYGNMDSRYFTPLFKRLRVGPRYYVQTQHWLTVILRYLCDSCCFGHSHLSEESLNLQGGAPRAETFERAQELLQLQADRAALYSARSVQHDDHGENDDDENDRARRLLLLDTDDDDDDDEDDDQMINEDDDQMTSEEDDENNVVAEIMLQPRDRSHPTRLLQYGRTLYAYCDPRVMEE